jgi:hypothetical protein
MVTHPTLQNASLRLRYLLNRFVEDRLNASAAALLKDDLDQESSRLATPLAELFATEQTPSA